jgi:hypothetical protein
MTRTPDAERDARHEGDYDAAYEDLQRMQTIAPAAEKGKRDKVAGGELAL